MTSGELFGLIYLIVRLAVLAGIVYYSIVVVIREGRKR
jgi:hypothetical protein